VTAFQASAGLQGRQFADQCDLLLDGMGYRRVGKVLVAAAGVEVDCEAVAPSGRRIWFEYKGSVQGPRPGLLRTDTLKKAIANGALLKGTAEAPPFVVLTSHVPTGGSGLAMLQTAIGLGYIDEVVCIYDPAQTGRLRTR
jgi:hypothetical protein